MNWRGSVKRNLREGENLRDILRMVEPTGDAFIGRQQPKDRPGERSLTKELLTLLAEGRFRGYATGMVQALPQEAERAGQHSCPSCQHSVEYTSTPQTCPLVGGNLRYLF
jgi:hypothetical protein